MQHIKSFASKNRFHFLPFVAFLLLSLAFMHYLLGFVALFALVPFLVWVVNYKGSRRKFVFIVWLSGYIFMLIVTKWMLEVSLGAWVMIHPALATAVLYAVWLIAGLLYSTGFLLLGFALHYLRGYKARAWFFAVFAFLWTASEVLRSVVFSVGALGPGGSIGVYWNFGALGFAAASTPLVYISRFGGVFVLSLFVVFVNVALYYAFIRKIKISAFAFMVVATLTLVGFLTMSNKQYGQRVAIVHSNEKTVPNYSQLLQNVRNVDLLLLPEYSEFELMDLDESLRKQIFSDEGGYITTRAGLGEPPVNEVIYADSEGKELSVQQKKFLIPTGEYMPYALENFFSFINKEYITESFNNRRQVAKGVGSMTPVMMPSGVQVGALACSGIIAPHLYKQLADQGADILVNSASLSVLQGSATYYHQSRQMARLISVHTNKPLLQSARKGPSFVMQNGAFVNEINTDGSSVVVVDI